MKVGEAVKKFKHKANCIMLKGFNFTKRKNTTTLQMRPAPHCGYSIRITLLGRRISTAIQCLQYLRITRIRSKGIEQEVVMTAQSRKDSDHNKTNNQQLWLLCAGLLALAEQQRQGALFFGSFFWANKKNEQRNSPIATTLSTNKIPLWQAQNVLRDRSPPLQRGKAGSPQIAHVLKGDLALKIKCQEHLSKSRLLCSWQ